VENERVLGSRNELSAVVYLERPCFVHEQPVSYTVCQPDTGNRQYANGHPLNRLRRKETTKSRLHSRTVNVLRFDEAILHQTAEEGETKP